MKKILIAIIALVPFLSFGQSDDTTQYTYYRNVYGNRTDRVWGNKVLRAPLDTIYSKSGLAILAGVLYVGNGVQWNQVTGGGGGSDSGIAVKNGIKATRSPTSPQRVLEADSSAYSTRARSQKLIDSLNAIFNAAITSYKLKSDSVGLAGYTTIATKNKLADSLTANFNALLALYKLKGDSVALGGYTTVAHANKIADSLRVVFNTLLGAKVDTSAKANIYFRGKGQPGDTAYVFGRDSTIWESAMRDSSGRAVHHRVNPDSSWTWYNDFFSASAAGIVAGSGVADHSKVLWDDGWGTAPSGGSGSDSAVNPGFAMHQSITGTTKTLNNDTASASQPGVMSAVDYTKLHTPLYYVNDSSGAGVDSAVYYDSTTHQLHHKGNVALWGEKQFSTQKVIYHGPDSLKVVSWLRLYKTMDSLNLIVLKKGDSTLYSTFQRLYKVVDSFNLVMLHKSDSAGVGYTTLARTRKVIDSLGALIAGIAGSAPGGTNMAIQYNKNGAFAGSDTHFYYDSIKRRAFVDSLQAQRFSITPDSLGNNFVLFNPSDTGTPPWTMSLATARVNEPDHRRNEVMSMGFNTHLFKSGEGYFRIGMEDHYHPTSGIQYELELPEVMLNDRATVLRGGFFVQPKDRACCGHWDWNADLTSWNDTRNTVVLGSVDKTGPSFFGYQTGVGSVPATVLTHKDSATGRTIGGFSFSTVESSGFDQTTYVFNSNVNSLDFHHGLLLRVDSIPSQLFGENIVITTPTSNTGNILWVGHDWGGSYRDDLRIYPSGHVALNTNSGSDIPSAQLSVISTTAGFLPPVMNTAQQNAISSPVTGLMIWNSDSLNYCLYNGTAWRIVSYTGAGGGGSFDSTSSQGGGFHTDGFNQLKYKQVADSNRDIHSYYSVGRGNKLADSLSVLIALKLSKADSNQTANSWASVGRINKIADSLANLFLKKVDSNQSIHSWASVGRLNKIADSLGALIGGGGFSTTAPHTWTNTQDFTGATVTVATQSPGDNTTKPASTAFTTAAIAAAGGGAAGGYLPTLTGVTNTASATPDSAYFIRSGDVCIVTGIATVAATAGGTVQVRISLPFSSNLGASARYLNGDGTGFENYTTAIVYCDNTNKEAVLKFNAPGTSGEQFRFRFTYHIN